MIEITEFKDAFRATISFCDKSSWSYPCGNDLTMRKTFSIRKKKRVYGIRKYHLFSKLIKCMQSLRFDGEAYIKAQVLLAALQYQVDHIRYLNKICSTRI